MKIKDVALFMKIDNGVEDDESEGSSDEGDESSDLSRITELRLVPSDPNQGALLHSCSLFFI